MFQVRARVECPEINCSTRMVQHMQIHARHTYDELVQRQALPECGVQMM